MTCNAPNLNEMHMAVISFLDAGTQHDIINQDENDENLSTSNDPSTRYGAVIPEPSKKGSIAMLRSLRKIQKALICPLCKKVMIEPVSIPCGHTFCCNCIDAHVDDSWYCPSKIILGFHALSFFNRKSFCLIMLSICFFLI
jgi:Zinc finger, C3HC4 type (RING finger)